jgi:hypothetical protein
LFALEGLAFWETPSPSNTTASPNFLILQAANNQAPTGETLKLQSQPTSPQLSKSTTVRSIPQTERATNNPPQINIIMASLRVATQTTKHNVENPSELLKTITFGEIPKPAGLTSQTAKNGGCRYVTF